MRNKIYIGMLLVVILLAACGNRDELMQSVLREAGGNRTELQ